MSEADQRENNTATTNDFHTSDMHYLQMRDASQSKSNMDQEFAQTKDYFGKLKYAFLELETKSQMLKLIQQIQIDESNNTCVFPQTNTTVADKKVKALKENKSRLESNNSKLREIITSELLPSLFQSHTKLESQKKEYDTKWETLKKLSEESEQLATTLQSQKQTSELHAHDISELEAIAEEQRLKMEGILADVTNAQSEKAKLEARLAQLQVKLSKQKTEEYSNSVQDFNDPLAQTLRRNQRLAEMASWYQSLLQTYERLSGIQVVSITPQQKQSSAKTSTAVVVLRFITPTANGTGCVRQHTVTVHHEHSLDSDQSHISKVEIQPNDFNSDDIIRYATLKNDIGLLIRELQIRVRQHLAATGVIAQRNIRAIR